ncbi:syndetin-like isoform X2 [Physella acuta]|uniref:syndetin-like isoform X1 n=1 Tax=Physella acuta TaxID=109671 RepID=UPI0027DBDFD4|nr:syndetin-like isoform X1 [Physella acuta]XP_059150714.1 syndetin-like isoform X2 [Physella acuta]
MAFKLKLKSLIGGRQESIQSPLEETVTDILNVGAAVTKSKVEQRAVNPHDEQEIIDGIEQSYYNNETFDTSLHELQKLPEQLDLDKITEDCTKLRTQLQAVTKRVSELILQNHPAYATELQRVMDLQRTLRSAGLVCRSGRRQLNEARENFTIASLGLLANYRKRQQLIGLLKSLGTIKTLQRTDLRLREMMEEEDYCGAIQLCLECQKAASTFKHYRCISELSSKLQDTLEMIEEQLDVALSKTCAGFDQLHYQKVQRAYKQLGKTQTAMDQLHMHFASAIHNTAFTIILGYVELTSGGGGAVNFQKRQYPDLCKNITIETFTPCLVDLCKALWEVMKSYYKTMKWHEVNDQDMTPAELEDPGTNVESTFNRRYVNQKLEYGRGRVWQDVQQKVKMFVLATNLSGFKLDEFIYVLDIINRMIEIGEEFCGSKSEGLQDSLKQQSLNYFKTHHQIRLDELRMFLENEAWEMCPVRSNFNILQLMEFRFMRKWANSRHLIPENERRKGENFEAASPDGDGKSYFGLYLEEGNPFDKQVEEEEKEDVFSGLGENEDGYADSDSDSDIPEELKKDYIDEITGEAHSYKHGRRRGSNRSKSHKQGPLITNTTLNVLRVMGKYLQMISILKPIAFDVISCMSQLFDYYLFTVYSFFGSEVSDKTVNTRLYTTLQRIKDNLIANPNPGSTVGGDDGTDKVAAALLSPLVRLSDASTLYGLAERVVATESLMFLGKQLEYLQPYLEELIPSNKKAFLSQFYSQTVNMAGEVRKPVYSVLSRQCISYDHILQQMGTVRWDVKEIMSQHNTYIDTLLKNLTEFQTRLEEVDKRVPLPAVVTKLIWEQCVRNANRTFVEGYASTKKCSNEGRALMQLDFQQFLSKLDHIIELRPIPEREYVESYIKAYYMSESELERWVHDHKEYSNKQLLSLINSVNHLDRKLRQKLINMVEVMDRGRRL